MIDFNKIPDWWALCPGYDCPRKEACLRHVALQQATKKVTQWRCVLPTAIGDGECKLFRGAEKVEMAKGLHAIYSDIASKRARSCIRKHLTEFLGSKGTYYRYMDGERLQRSAALPHRASGRQRPQPFPAAARPCALLQSFSHTAEDHCNLTLNPFQAGGGG